MSGPAPKRWHKPVIVELVKGHVEQSYIDGLGELEAVDLGMWRKDDRDILSPEFSEDRLALRFASRHGADLRYVAAWGKWMTWTGSHWEIENTLAVFDMARKICRGAANLCNTASEAKAIAKAKTIAAVETLARSDRKIAATVDQWDAAQSFFNSAKEPK
jgi:putative DNA primase/helicase